MLDFPAYDAEIVTKSLIDRTAWPCNPGAQCRSIAKTRRVRFEAQEVDKVVILANADLSRGAESTPQARCKLWISCEVRVVADQILGNPRDKSLRINIGERSNLFVG